MTACPRISSFWNIRKQVFRPFRSTVYRPHIRRLFGTAKSRARLRHKSPSTLIKSELSTWQTHALLSFRSCCSRDNIENRAGRGLRRTSVARRGTAPVPTGRPAPLTSWVWPSASSAKSGTGSGKNTTPGRHRRAGDRLRPHTLHFELWNCGNNVPRVVGNPLAISAVASAIAFGLIQAVLGAFFYGKLVGAVTANASALKEVVKDVDSARRVLAGPSPARSTAQTKFSVETSSRLGPVLKGFESECRRAFAFAPLPLRQRLPSVSRVN